jgi:gas vesicle structural protein
MIAETATPRAASRPVKPAARRIREAALVSRQRSVSLCETLDRVLNKGAVIAGDIIISVADVDLLYLGLSLVVTSVETVRQWAEETEARGNR